MGKQVRFELQDQTLVAESPLSVRELLKLADVETDSVCIEDAAGNVLCEPDELVKIHDGDRLRLTRRSPEAPLELHYKVNGEEQTTTSNPMTVEAILRRAGLAAGVDPADPGNYYVENIADGSRYEELGDLITIKDGDQFLAIHQGATPVA